MHWLFSQEAELGLVGNEFGECFEKEMRHCSFLVMLLHFSNSTRIQGQPSSVRGEITAIKEPKYHVMEIEYILIRLIRLAQRRKEISKLSN